MPTTRNLAILIFEDVEVLDFCGPFEVFSVANRFTDPPAFNVFTVAEKPGPVLTRGSLSVNPHHRLADCPRHDLLLVPGGQGTRREMHHAVLTDWINRRAGPCRGAWAGRRRAFALQEELRPHARQDVAHGYLAAEVIRPDR